MNIPFLSRFGTLAQGSRTYGARALIDIRDEFAWHANILHEPLYVYMKAKVMASQEQQRNIHKIISESKTYICYSVTVNHNSSSQTHLSLSRCIPVQIVVSRSYNRYLFWHVLVRSHKLVRHTSPRQSLYRQLLQRTDYGHLDTHLEGSPRELNTDLRIPTFLSHMLQFGRGYQVLPRVSSGLPGFREKKNVKMRSAESSEIGTHPLVSFGPHNFCR